MSDNLPIPQLYFILDLARSGDPLSEIEAALQVTPIVSLLIKDTPQTDITQDLVKALQAHNIAVLLEDSDKVRALMADGVHLNTDEPCDFEQVKQRLDDNDIIGVSSQSSRHGAMTIAEQGASYIAIEATGSNTNDENEQQMMDENQLAPTIDWWVALFETPCVAWNIETIEAALTAQRMGADFLALAPTYWQRGQNTFDVIQELQTALTENAIEQNN